MMLLIFFCLSLNAEPMGFNQALDTMIDTNVDVRIQRTKVEASKSQLWAARGSFTPTLSLQAQEQKSGGNATSFSGTTVYPTAQTFAATAAWNIFRSGSDLASLRAANKDLDLQNSQLEDSVLLAEDKSARALIDVVQKKLVLDSLKRAEASAKHFASIAQSRFNKSLLSREEADKVMIDAGNAESKRTDAELQFNEALASVEALLGSDKVNLDWPWMKRLSMDSEKSYLDAESEKKALEDRPDIHAAQNAYDSQDQRDRALFRAMLPTIDLTYSVGETHMNGSSISSWAGSAMLTIPLWNGYHDYAAYRVQVENRNASEARLSQLRREVTSSVHSSQSNFKLSVEQYSSRERNLELARHILDQDELRFKLGRANANDLDLDLRRVTEAEILAVQGVAQAHVAYMQLMHAFGRRAE